MASNKSKYSEDMRERTARHVIESGKSATSMAEELGIDVNTVCRWVRAYRRKNNLPSYAEAKGIKRSEPKTSGELVHRVKELEKELKIKDKQLEEEKAKVEILKKSLHIFMQPQG
jgi:transposase-like protein